MDLTTNWSTVRSLFNRSFRSSFHYSVATVDEHGAPHLTPIGSLMLGEPGRGIYFEEFPQRLPRNLEKNNRICVLAVDSSRWFWLRSLLAGRFASPPAVRLNGVVGERREATEKERRRWMNRVKPVRFTRGHALLWRRMGMVREIEFTQIRPVSIGEMTRGIWR